MSQKTNLQDWFMSNRASEEMIYKKASENQIMFVRDNLSCLVTGKSNNVFVISTHTSKSIKLPVYSLEREGLQIILRNNFYNWKMSVISKQFIELDFSGLFHTSPPIDPDYTGDSLASCYFEGFPEKLIFGYYDLSNHKKWSAEISSNYELWTVLFVVLHKTGGIKALKWSIRPVDQK